MQSQGLSLQEEIARKDLYFRISLTTNCNYKCQYCHQEGATTKVDYDIELPFIIQAIKTATEIGFRRVQFTGGEPLLRDDIGLIIKESLNLVDDVGITTNGYFLPKKIGILLENRIKRIHISLVSKSLLKAGRNGLWGIPAWLYSVLDYANIEQFDLRINLPIPPINETYAESFIIQLLKKGANVGVFPILPVPNNNFNQKSNGSLKALVESLNLKSIEEEWKGSVFYRNYLSPKGLRCSTCDDYENCKENSHSLRLGADKILRPCLASRMWDIQCDENDMKSTILKAAYFAIDYE